MIDPQGRASDWRGKKYFCSLIFMPLIVNAQNDIVKSKTAIRFDSVFCSSPYQEIAFL